MAPQPICPRPARLPEAGDDGRRGHSGRTGGGDVPNLDTSKLTTGLLAVARGGTGATLAATGPGFLKQTSCGRGVHRGHTHRGIGRPNLVTDLAGKAASVHTHTSAQISDATAAATASTVVLRDGSAGANFGYVAANNLWGYADSHLNRSSAALSRRSARPSRTWRSTPKTSASATWDKNGGTCTVTANAIAAPDGNTTADTVTAVARRGLIQQHIAGLASGGQYTFYVWPKVASGTKKVSLAIVDNGWTTWLAGPTAVTLTTAWQRFKITGTMTGGATGLWVVVGQYADGGRLDLVDLRVGRVPPAGQRSEERHTPGRGGTRLRRSRPESRAARLWSWRRTARSRRSGSPAPARTSRTTRCLQVTAGGELIIAGGTGNGYRLAELMGATNPSGWSGVLKVKNPAGVTAGYILLYSNP